jgi:serine kinase of HPr protein (carbohydrate metabolism regulator)
VAVATLVGALVIMVCHDREIPEEMITAASNEGVAILKTPLNQYHTSARIYRAFGS